MTIEQYVVSITKRYKLGNSTEHTFRGDLQLLLESLVPEIRATNEPKRQSCGAPDFILTRKEIPVGFIEAKDIDDGDLDGIKKTGNKEQFDRYKTSLSNLIFTDYLSFHLYRDGSFVTKVSLAELVSGVITPLPGNYQVLSNLLKDFCAHQSQTINSSRKLAEMMAGKARLLSDIIERALSSDKTHNEDSTLKDQLTAFKEILIHDITAKGFADVYAQTIAYGMFAARLHDPTLPTFSRQEAAELIPKSNPFLRKLFGYIAGPDIDDRIKWIVDSLVDIFLACNVRDILKNYGKNTKMEDPIIHFYETFLSEYDPKLRKARGVWYTPAPIVNFIVRAVDDILKSEFNLPNGLADNSKTKIKVNLQQTDKRFKENVNTIQEEVHRVQILDPATGTGTFLAEVIKHVHKSFEGQQGAWSNYVEKHLLPRLNGFELLMASYAMAHLQLDMLLTDTGYKKGTDQRLRVYLTNSLEESHPDTGTLFANWLSTEANEANHIKRDTPVMCVIGNPPYSGESSNKGKWIMGLMEDYKKEPGGKEKLKEKNSKFINDDYVKFLRYGQHFIEKNGSGVLAFINPHGFLDNPTFRGMRWNLLKTYDKIYTIDLHGNAKKRETAPDGSADMNVFDIEQGVSINFFIKTGSKSDTDLGQVFHFDLYGKRDLKYDYLQSNSLNTTPFEKVANLAPGYFFTPKDFKYKKQFDKGFAIDELFEINSLGIQTHRDKFIIDFSKSELENRIKDVLDVTNSNGSILSKYKLKESSDFQLHKVRQSIFDNNKFVKIDYRPFDIRHIYYDKGFIDRDRSRVMKHLLRENSSLVISKHLSSFDFQHIFVSKHMSESCLISIQTKEQGYCFPLYLYSDISTQHTIGLDENRTPNLKPSVVMKIAENTGLVFTREKDISNGTFAPIDILDYIYAVLHSPNYRKDYKAFLKIDFPKVPYPEEKTTFWRLAHLGGELRKVHLLEGKTIGNYITQYPVDGDNRVGKVRYQDGNVHINETQYFSGVPQLAWEFYIGGHQPAQKWLKERNGHVLEYHDILHFQKIIVALNETLRLMSEIDKVDFL
jgi:predicted helicase